MADQTTCCIWKAAGTTCHTSLSASWAAWQDAFQQLLPWRDARKGKVAVTKMLAVAVILKNHGSLERRCLACHLSPYGLRQTLIGVHKTHFLLFPWCPSWPHCSISLMVGRGTVTRGTVRSGNRCFFQVWPFKAFPIILHALFFPSSAWQVRDNLGGDPGGHVFKIIEPQAFCDPDRVGKSALWTPG